MGVLAELLVPGLLLAPNIFNMKILSLLCLSTTAMAMPFNSTTSSNQTWISWAQGHTETIVEPLYEFGDQVVQGWEWLQEFLPGKVTNYVEKTADDGLELLDDIYQETRDSVVEKTSDNVDDITGLVEDFIQKLTNIKDNTLDIVSQEGALSQEEIEARNVEEN